MLDRGLKIKILNLGRINFISEIKQMMMNKWVNNEDIKTLEIKYFKGSKKEEKIIWDKKQKQFYEYIKKITNG
jgi:lantibiotic modifying enzyme